MQVHGPSQLATGITPSSGQDHRGSCSAPWPPLSFRGGRLDPLYLSYLHGNLLPDHLWGTTSDCAELKVSFKKKKKKVSFWPVKPSSPEVRKDQETHNQNKQVMVTWQGSIFFPAPSPNHSKLVKAGKKKKLSSVSYVRLQYSMFSNTWSYFFLEWTFEEGVMLLWDEVLKKL